MTKKSKASIIAEKQEIIEDLMLKLNASHAKCCKLEEENSILRHSLDLAKFIPATRVRNDFQVDSRSWGIVPDILIVLRRNSRYYAKAVDQYYCEVLIEKLPCNSMALNIATNAVTDMLYFAMTGDRRGGNNGTR